MKHSWTTNLEPDQAREIKADFKAAHRLRERLEAMLEHKISVKAKEGRSDDLYSSPNWQLTQADNHGYIKALEYCISLIKE